MLATVTSRDAARRMGEFISTMRVRRAPRRLGHRSCSGHAQPPGEGLLWHGAKTELP